MKTRKKTIEFFTCETCNTEYDNKADALKCESLPVEKPVFKIGDIVRAKEIWIHENRQFRLVGYIVKIITDPPDREYILKWLHDTNRLKMHNLLYQVSIDPKDTDAAEFYAPEIELTNKKVGMDFIEKEVEI